MKTIITFLVCFLVLGSVKLKAQAPDWQWGKQVDGSVPGQSWPSKMVLDRSGNMYVSGFFDHSITLGDSTYTESESSNSGDLVLIKYDKNGNVLWSKHPIGATGSYFAGLAIDSSDNCYLTGWSSDGFIDETHPTPKGEFIVKFDSGGNIQWVHMIGITTTNVFALVSFTAIEVDKIGQVYFTGYFSDTLTIDGITIMTNRKEHYDMLLAKFDRDGKALWLKQASGLGSICQMHGTSLSVRGNVENVAIYVAGTIYADTALFEKQMILGRKKLMTDMFLARYSVSGNLLWVRHTDLGKDSAATLGVAWSVQSDVNDNAYLCGSYQSDSAYFGDSTFHTNNEVPNSNGFIAKYNNTGTLQWVRQVQPLNHRYGTSSIAEVRGVSIAANQQVFICGDIPGTSQINDLILERSHSGFFISSLDKNGNTLWVRSGDDDTTNYSYLQNCAFSRDGDLYVTGGFISWLSLGPSSLFRNDQGSQQRTLFVGKTQSVTLGISPQNISSASIKIFPNPASSQATVSFMLAKSSTVNLEVYDLLGRRMKQVSLGEMREGEHSETLDLHGFGDGTYFCRMTVGGEASSMMFTIIK